MQESPRVVEVPKGLHKATEQDRSVRCPPGGQQRRSRVVPRTCRCARLPLNTQASSPSRSGVRGLLLSSRLEPKWLRNAFSCTLSVYPEPMLMTFPNPSNTHSSRRFFLSRLDALALMSFAKLDLCHFTTLVFCRSVPQDYQTTVFRSPEDQFVKLLGNSSGPKAKQLQTVKP